MGKNDTQAAVALLLAATADMTINNWQVTCGQQPHDCTCFEVCDGDTDGGSLLIPVCMALHFDVPLGKLTSSADRRCKFCSSVGLGACISATCS